MFQIVRTRMSEVPDVTSVPAQAPFVSSQTRQVHQGSSDVTSGTSLIHLNNGGYVLVDAADYVSLSRFRWSKKLARSTTYAFRWNGQRWARMHREIMRPPDNMDVDHINHDGLDNRRENLRICTQAQNVMHSRKSRGRNRFKGVWRHGKNWCAVIVANKKIYRLGSFQKEEDAAAAYNAAAIRLHGEFAVLNELHAGCPR